MVGIWEMTEGPIKKLGFLEKKKKRNRQSGRDFEAIINELKDLLNIDDLGINAVIHTHC